MLKCTQQGLYVENFSFLTGVVHQVENGQVKLKNIKS